MKTLTFTISKGGVGKSLLTANVSAALAERGKKVILVEGDPNHPLQLILNVDLTSKDTLFDEVLKKDLKIEKAVHPTNINNLFLIPSGVSLQDYFNIDPIRFAQKITSVDTDFLFVDVPFPLGNAAFLSLGICEYFIPILTEDEFALCVESTLDTIRVGKYYLKCIPIGFILNRIKSKDRFTQKFVNDLEDLLGIPCITRIEEDPNVSKSYGGAGSENAFLAYGKFQGTDFAKNIDKVTDSLLGELPRPEKEDVVKFIQEIVKMSKRKPTLS